jgi:hypothetical protein
MERKIFVDVDGFEWDFAKRRQNREKHGVDFDEAIEVFYGPHLLRQSDRKSEERWIAVGETENRILAVVFTVREQKIRIISARRARKNEERAYRNEKMGRPTQGQD